MFRDEQNKLSYYHRNGVAEVVKPIIMANAVHNGWRESYFSILYLFFRNPVNQMYALSYRVSFI